MRFMNPGNSGKKKNYAVISNQKSSHQFDDHSIDRDFDAFPICTCVLYVHTLLYCIIVPAFLTTVETHNCHNPRAAQTHRLLWSTDFKAPCI